MDYCPYCNQDRPDNHISKCPACNGWLHVNEEGDCSCANCGREFHPEIKVNVEPENRNTSVEAGSEVAIEEFVLPLAPDEPVVEVAAGLPEISESVESGDQQDSEELTEGSKKPKRR